MGCQSASTSAALRQHTNRRSLFAGPITKAIPDKSASSIGDNPVDYDEFSALSEIVTSYICNERLRAIREWQPERKDVEALANMVRLEYRLPRTLGNIPGGSETSLVDPNLQQILKSLTNFLPSHITGLSVKKKKLPYDYMAQSNIPEHCLYDDATFVALIGCEAKGVQGSTRRCCSQLITVCGNSALRMCALGVPRDSCVALGIAVADTGVQFSAVYLMDKSFPVFLQLTPTLHPLQHMTDIATWLLRYLHGACGTQGLLQQHYRPNVPPLQVTMQLDTDSYFLKPVRGGYKATFSTLDAESGGSILPRRLDGILRIYDHLYNALTQSQHATGSETASSAEAAEDGGGWSILFPVGFITVPTVSTDFSMALTAAILRPNRFRAMRHCLAGRPCMVFPKLPMASSSDADSLTHWRTTRPPLALVRGYLAAVSNAVNFLNAACVAHFDLRPCNVLWRVASDERVEVMVIDFDDAIAFGEVVPSSFVEGMKIDKRFPLYKADPSVEHRACADHNDFFVRWLTLWLDDESVDVSFDSFMEHREEATEVDVAYAASETV